MKRFRLKLVCDQVLTEKQIWSDGYESPENPTIEDVVDVLEDYGGLINVIDDWRLAHTAEVTEIEAGSKEEKDYKRAFNDGYKAALSEAVQYILRMKIPDGN